MTRAAPLWWAKDASAMPPLPPPASTTDVYLAAVIERLDQLIALINRPPAGSRRRKPDA